MADSAQSSNLPSEARDILIASSHTDMVAIITDINQPKDTDEYKLAKAKYALFVEDYLNLLAIKILRIYLSSSYGKNIRILSISLLSETLTDLSVCNFEFSEDALEDIKPLVISCLELQESQESQESEIKILKILGRIVSAVAHNVALLDHGNCWKELIHCIVKLADEDPLKALHVFIDLPVRGSFIFIFMEKIQAKAYNMLLNPEEGRVEDWIFALINVVKLGVLALDTETRYDMIHNILTNLVNAAEKLVKNGNEEFLLRGLDDLEKFLLRDKTVYDYNNSQCHFILLFAYKLQGIGTHIKDAIFKINQLVLNIHNPDVQLSLQPQEKLLELNKSWFDRLKKLGSLEVLRVFSSNEYDDMSRELAIIRLNHLLSDHTSEKMRIDFSVIIQLEPLLISCMLEQGSSDRLFKLLGEVVNHVAYEMFIIQKVAWPGLLKYIASRSHTEFERAVYIFQCLTMPLEDESFVNCVVKNLLPEIRKRLELLLDNSSWVWGFTAAFCSVIHLVQSNDIYAHCVKELSLKMVKSVTELVERGTEDGFVRRAFRDMENIVQKQLKWYSPDEYKFLKALLWRLYEVIGMEEETKSRLATIYMILDNKVARGAKELAQIGEFDWLNQPEA